MKQILSALTESLAWDDDGDADCCIYSETTTVRRMDRQRYCIPQFDNT